MLLFSHRDQLQINEQFHSFSLSLMHFNRNTPRKQTQLSRSFRLRWINLASFFLGYFIVLKRSSVMDVMNVAGVMDVMVVMVVMNVMGFIKCHECHECHVGRNAREFSSQTEPRG